MMEKLVYSITEAAEVLGISKSHAYELVKQNKLPVVELGKRRVIIKESLEQWLQQNMKNVKSRF